MSDGLPEPEGVLLVDKPQGITSHDVVDKVRWLYQTRRVGHAGTLDPMATGLLIILVGKATKASQYLMSQEKEYLGEATLGVVTDSQDADGVTTETNPVPELTPVQVAAAMATMLGDQHQLPPMHSAKKIAVRNSTSSRARASKSNASHALSASKPSNCSHGRAPDSTSACIAPRVRMCAPSPMTSDVSSVQERTSPCSAARSQATCTSIGRRPSWNSAP